jgi:purine catabolism regulator
MDITAFLKLPMFEDFKLLAGESGITNQITGVNILDNPKATDWLSPGELIVTSGYFF